MKNFYKDLIVSTILISILEISLCLVSHPNKALAQSPITINSVAYDYTNTLGVKITVTGVRNAVAFTEMCDMALNTCTVSGVSRNLSATQIQELLNIVPAKANAYVVTSAYQSDPTQ